MCLILYKFRRKTLRYNLLYWEDYFWGLGPLSHTFTTLTLHQSCLNSHLDCLSAPRKAKPLPPPPPQKKSTGNPKSGWRAEQRIKLNEFCHYHKIALKRVRELKCLIADESLKRLITGCTPELQLGGLSIHLASVGYMGHDLVTQDSRPPAN